MIKRVAVKNEMYVSFAQASNMKCAYAGHALPLVGEGLPFADYVRGRGRVGT